ncbi:MAG: hypothetical protein HPY64_10445 [Anaerolineae bacterium]|nr:hypothetical protein [Anaerolineae bacterium]
MAAYEVTRPRPDVVRVAFLPGWDAERDSEPMFREVLAKLDEADQEVTLLIVAGEFRPVYEEKALQPARGILYHDNIKKIIVVAKHADLAVAHMGASRGERGLSPIPMFAFASEGEALAEL